MVVALRWAAADRDDVAGEPETSLHDLRTGKVLATLGSATDFRTVVDTYSNAVVVIGLDGFTETRAYDLGSGELRWKINGADKGLVDITVADRGVGYGTRAGQSVVVEPNTGRILEQGDWPVPVASAAGTLLTALPRDPAAEPGDRLSGAGPGYVAYRSQ